MRYQIEKARPCYCGGCAACGITDRSSCVACEQTFDNDDLVPQDLHEDPICKPCFNELPTCEGCYQLIENCECIDRNDPHVEPVKGRVL